MQRTASRSAGISAVVLAAAVAAGCGAAGSHNTGSHNTGSAGGTHPVTAMDAVRLAASQTSQTRSLTGVVSTRMSGQRPGAMQGTMAMRTQPSLAMEMNATSIAMNGQSVPGGMREILTSNGIYVHAQQLASRVGKPWILIPASSLNQATGNAFSQFSQQIQQQDPLSSARMLGAATDVRQTGTGTAGGVPVTRYSGVIPVQRGLSKLKPQVRQQAQRQLSSMGVSTVSFIAAVDQQHRIRQLTEQMNGTAERMMTTFSVTSLNQPVTIQPPPASQVATMPANGPSSGSAPGSSPGTAG